MIRHFIFPLFIVLFAAAITARAQIVPPGTVINHWYAEDGKYIVHEVQKHEYHKFNR